MDNAEIKVSVIMPVYNAGEYLYRAISDVLSQSLKEIELICIDDGSNDGSKKIIKKFAGRDSRVKVISQSNSGPSVARNRGIEIAVGEYMMFLDADDFFEPDLIKTLYEMAKEHTLDIAVAKFDIYNEEKDKFFAPAEEPEGNIFSPGVVTSKNEHPSEILQSTTGYAWNKLFSSALIRDKQLAFDPELFVFEDVHFVCTALSVAERVERIDKVLLHHRVYSDQSRARLFRKYYSQVPIVYKKIKEFLMSHGLYVPLMKSYLNMSVGRCYKIFNLLWDDGKEKLWDMLHSGYAEEFGWYRHEKDVFESLEYYEFATNVGLYTYKEHTEKDKNIDPEQMDKETFKKKKKKRENMNKFKFFFKWKK